MGKSVALIYYSQSGQSQKLTYELKSQLEAAAHSVVLVNVKSEEDFAFPWKASHFFAQMPRCICEEAIAIEETQLPSLEGIESVVLVHPVWFLSPSLAVLALLKSPWAKRELCGKKLLQVLTCRNMWFEASRKSKRLLRSLGVKFLGTVPVCDPSPNWASLLTTPLWMLTGNKQVIKSLPPAGIPDEKLRIVASKVLATQEFQLVEGASFEPNEELRVGIQRPEAVSIAMEIVGHAVVFRPWGTLIFSTSNRLLKKLFLLGFRLSLVVTILVLLPIFALLSRVASEAFVSFARKAVSV